MSNSGKKKYDRRTMRSFAVSAVFAYDFILKEAAEAEKERKKEAEAAARKKPPRPSDSVVVNKVVGKGTRRRTKMTLLEYEEKYVGKDSDVLKLLGLKDAEEENKEAGAAEPQEKPFDTEEFIQDVLSSQLEEEGADEIIFADLPDYQEYLYPVVNGVIENIGEIDGYIGRNLTGWSIDRVKRTDLAVLRVAVFELVHFGDVVPLEIAINEAVENAKATDVKSGSFVNGVLAGVVRELKGE